MATATDIVTRLTGTVVELHIKSNENWARAKVRDADGRVAWVTAKFGLNVGETLDAHCTFNQKFKSFDVVRLVDAGGVVSNDVVVLKLVQELAGVGQVKAARLSQQFPDNLYEVMVKTPEIIAEACGVDLEEVTRVATILDSENDILARVSKLLAYGYTGNIAKKIAGKEAAWKLALDCPYSIIRLIDGLGWLTADEVGRKNKVPLDSPKRIAAGIDHYYRNQVTLEGHTKVTLDQLCSSEALPNLLGLPREKIEPHIDTVLINLDNGYYTNDRHRANAQTIAGFFGV